MFLFRNLPSSNMLLGGLGESDLNNNFGGPTLCCSSRSLRISSFFLCEQCAIFAILRVFAVSHNVHAVMCRVSLVATKGTHCFSM